MKIFRHRYSHIIIFIFCFSVLILKPTLHAKTDFMEWKDNIPSSLMPFNQNAQLLGQLAQDRIVIYAHPAIKTFVPTAKNKYPTVQFTSAAIVLPASIEQTEQTLTKYENYVGLFPTLKTAKTIKQNQHKTLMRYHVYIPTPIPLLNFKEDLVFQHQLEKNSLSSLVLEAPIPYGIGKFEWFRIDEQHTLLTLTQWGDLDQPKGFILSRIFNALPEAKLGIPSGTNTFILESLRKKFSSNNAQTLAANELPRHQLSATQLSLISQISATSKQPVSIVYGPSSVPYPQGRENMRFVTTFQYSDQAPNQLQKWLNPASYQQLFPRQLKKISLENTAANQQNVNFKVHIGLGIINIPFDFKVQYQYPTPLKNQFIANGGDLKLMKGQMNLTQSAKGSLLEMTTTAKIDQHAPFILRAARSLPYYDLLPTVGANTVFALKINMNKQ